MRKLSRIINKRESGIEYPKDEKVVLHNLIGLELEIENVSVSTITPEVTSAPLWSIAGDGSLRNSGVELISVPVSGVNLTNAITELKDILEKGAPDAEITERCSLHVHIDMRDITVRQLLNFLVVYTIFEDELFRYVGYKRKENPYCVPLTDAYNLQELMEELTGTDKQVNKLIYDWPKYSAVNLKPLLRLGTIEVRLHPGTLDPQEVLAWANILLSIKKYIMDNPRRNTQTIIDYVCSNPEKLINDVFNNKLIQEINTDTIDGMLEGARIAQQLYRYRDVLKMDTQAVPSQHTRTTRRRRASLDDTIRWQNLTSTLPL